MIYKNKFIKFIFFYYLFNIFKKYFSKKFIILFNKKNLFYLPFIGKKIKKSLYTITKQLENDINNINYNNLLKLPNKSQNDDVIQNKINELKNFDKKDNQISGTIYTNDNVYKQKLVNVFSQFIGSNPLHPDIFKSIREMEIDIINMCSNLFNGSSKCCGNVTYGGTESIMLACITYRELGFNEKGITQPNIIAFNSVHPAFDKACFYYKIKLIKIPINLQTGTNCAKKIKSYINSNTICIVGSTPSYPHGIIDPIEEMSKIAFQKNIGFHVDCCLGGFLIPFLFKKNKINNIIDFRNKGVTSISMDTHKYGYTLKGSSVLLFKNYNYKQYQHFIYDKWNGGIYATPTTMGSKSGALIATTWAALQYNGYENYCKFANEIQNNLLLIKHKFKNNTDIEIIGDPNINIIAFSSKKLNIYSVANEMKNKNWNLSIMQYPPSFHFCITKNHDSDLCNKFTNDLLNSINYVKNNKTKLSGTLAIYGTNSKINKNLFLKNIINNFIILLSRKTISEKYI